MQSKGYCLSATARAHSRIALLAACSHPAHSSWCHAAVCCWCHSGTRSSLLTFKAFRLIYVALCAGLDILQASVHLSGNPVPWDVHHGALHREMFVMLHTKHPEYVNWAVRMDRDTHVITHISAGPLLRNQDYRNEVSAVPPKPLAWNGVSVQAAPDSMLLSHIIWCFIEDIGRFCKCPNTCVSQNLMVELSLCLTHCPQHCCLGSALKI